MDYKSTTLLNAIRNGASVTYKERVPEATAQNLAETCTSILEYDVTRNEFVAAIVNKIGLSLIKDKQYTNPLKEFKKGTLETGGTIEEIFVELIKSAKFDPNGSEDDVFKRNLPDVRAIYHTINREDQYPTTTSMGELRAAFTGENALMDLVSKIVSKLYTSDEMDEFLIMKGLLEVFGVEGKFIPVVVPAVTNEATAKAAMVKIKEISNNMIFMSSKYNHSGVHTFTPKADQIVLINTAFDALVDVEVLASAFNMEKADFIGRRVLVDDFGGLSNILCAIVDKDWFMCYDVELAADQIWNPKGRYFNHFLTHRGIYSVSPLENAVIFVTVAPTVTGITLSQATAAASATKASSLQLYVEAAGTNNPPSKCTWESDTEGVFVNSMGLVYIAPNTGNKTATITATNAFNAARTATCVITVGTGA